jgi:GNAT superfamily N-acetyltransferase
MTLTPWSEIAILSPGTDFRVVIAYDPGGRILMIRRCDNRDFEQIWAIINDAARAYKGIIPADCWTEPYMSRKELRHELDEGVEFWGLGEAGTLAGVMGLQQVRDVTLIRHAYVLPSHQKRGIGARLLVHLREFAKGAVLIGTWTDAVWAIRFYERHGFQLIDSKEKDRLLKQYWTVPERQREVSVVLADPKWLGSRSANA